jgi:S1-C subfamily serine protease
MRLLIASYLLAVVTVAVSFEETKADQGWWFSNSAGGVGNTDYNPLRYSVVRIEAVAGEFDWLEPFFGSQSGVGLGTGWVVSTDPEPVFITNAHVVSNAHDVKLQLLVHGNQKWEAEVVMITQKFDMALLVLKQKDQFIQELTEANMALQALPISEKVPTMGLPVVALGFPLGMNSLKISSGVVAGNEEVEGLICIQSTAPISPGSSGGPLLLDDGSAVVGINFAKSSSLDAENVNYVIPGWRVRAFVNSYKRAADSPEYVQKRKQVHIPSADAVIVEANQPLRKLMNCTEGLFLSNLGPKSFFLQATPPIPQKSFLLKVRGVEIDQFGMGWDKDFCEDRVQYTDLLFMQDDINGEVEVEVCHQGTVSTHKVPLDWRSDAYDVGIRYVEEPEFEEDLTQYVLFGDIAIMQLTFNHIESLYKVNPLLAGYLLPEERKQNRLLIPFVMPGSYAGEFLMPGDIIRKVNGHEVFTLEDFKTHFIPDELKDASEAPAPAPCDQAATGTATEEEIKAAVEAAVAEAMRNLQNGQGGNATEDQETLLATAASTAPANASLPAPPKAAGFLQTKAKVRPSQRRPADGLTDAALRKLAATARNESSPDSGEYGGGYEDGYGDYGDGGYGDGGYGDGGNDGGMFSVPIDSAESAELASDEGKVVWTLETEGGQIYAVFFDDMLEEQVMEAETSESAYLMTSVVLQAAQRRNILKRSPLPFVRGLLERSTKPAHLQLRSAKARASVPPPASKLRAEIPVKKAGRSGGWRPTVQSSFPQVHLS